MRGHCAASRHFVCCHNFAQVFSSQLAALFCRVQHAEAQVQGAHKAAKKEFEGKLQEARKECDTLSALNKSLISNQKAWREKVTELQQACSTRDGTIKDLQEQVHDLMMFIEGTKAAQENAEIAGGSAEVGEQPRGVGRRRQRK